MSEPIRCEATYANGSRCAREGRISVQSDHGEHRLCPIHRTRILRKGGVTLHDRSYLVEMPNGLRRYVDAEDGGRGQQP